MTDTGGFFAITVRRPIGALVLLVTMLVVGGIAYREIPLQLLPSGFSEPSLNIWIPTPESSARENEEKVARVIEEQLRTLAGIDEVTSNSNASRVWMEIEFNAGLDLDFAKAEVRDRIERARPLLPDGVEEIEMWSEDADSLPLAFFGILHEGEGERTDYLIDKVVQPRLEAVRGISRVDIWGGGADSMRILLDEDKVVAARMDLGELVRRLTSDNFTEPLGELDDGGNQVLLRSDMRFRTPEEIAEFPIGDGLRIRDVGEVRQVKSVRNSLARIDGSYSYTGMVSRESQVNIVEASRNFKEAIERIEEDPRVAGDLSFVTFWVPGDMVEATLSQLQETAAFGGVLAIVILFVFLWRLRLTLCVAMSIPVSAIMAIAWEYFSGESFNVLTMAGITLAVGMLVDNSVVVVENIARFRDRGEDALSAAGKGAREISLAVTLATLTTVVVFVPMMFMSEHPLMRTIFIGIGRPLCVSLLVSLFVALAFLPVISARILGKRAAWIERSGRTVAPLMRIPVRIVSYLIALVRILAFLAVRALHVANRAALATTARWPLRIVVAAIPFGVAALVLLRTAPALEVGRALDRDAWGFVEQVLPGVLFGAATAASLLVLFAMPRWWRRDRRAPSKPASFVPRGNSLIEMTTDLNAAVVGWTMRHRLLATALSGVCMLTVVIPGSYADFAAFTQEEDTTSVRFFFEFEADFTLAEAASEITPYEDFVEERRARYGFENWNCRFDDRRGQFNLYWERALDPERLASIKRDLKDELPRLPGHKLVFYDEENTNTRQKSVAFFRLRGPDSEVLEGLGAEAVSILAGVPGLTGVRSPLEDSPETLQVEIDRDLALTMGVSSEATVNSIAYTLRGWMVSRFHDEGREIPLLVEYDEEEIAGMGTLRDLSIWTEEGRVPLSSFSNLSVARGERSIHRRNGQTTFDITAEIEDPTQVMAVTLAGNQALDAKLDLPRGYTLGLEDSFGARQEEELSQMRNALMLSVVLVFLLMGILFESVLLPFSVLFTIPFAILGAMWTVFLTGVPMDFMGWIGLIILSGVVVNNGIVLIDRIHRLVLEGVPRTEAVIQGCAQRVRPVLMTALTTVGGLLPMAVMEPATNTIPYRALATVVAGGLVASTFFTLWVVPLAYTVFADLSRTLSLHVRWWVRPPRVRTIEVGEPAA